MTTIRRTATMSTLSAILIAGVGAGASATASADAGASSGSSAAQPTYPGASTTVPWDQVGQGWTVFRYGAPGQDVQGQYHLVSPSGAVYATGISSATRLEDVSDSGTHVPLETFEEVNDGKYAATVHTLDLRSGQRTNPVNGGEDTAVADVHFAGSSSVRHSGVFAGMDGMYGVYARTTDTRWLLDINVDGGDPWDTLVAEKVLPTNGGTATVLGADERLRRVNHSTGRVELSWPIPSSFYRACAPTRWWSLNSMVADCRSTTGKHSVYLQGPTGASERLTTWAGKQGAGITDAWYRKGGWMIVDSPKTLSGTTVLRYTTQGYPAVTTGYNRSDTTPLTVIGDTYYAAVKLDSGRRIISNNLVTGSTKVLVQSGPTGSVLDAHTINLRD